MKRSTNRTKLNKIVRSDLPGGAETLDALEVFHKIQGRPGLNRESQEIATLARDKIAEIADKMREIAKELQREALK